MVGSVEAAAEAAERFFEAGRVAWPDIALSFATFEPYFARCARADDPPRERHAADMYLACASAYGVDHALPTVDRLFADDVRRALAAVDGSRAFADDILQATRERLLVARPGEPARIIDYAGRASLQAWLAVVAVRWAISQRRRRADQAHFPVPEETLVAGRSPEFDYFVGQYKAPFEEAVRHAMRQLDSKERLLLRLNLVDGLSVDGLGALYHVGRSTAARWLAAARAKLFDTARTDLRTRLGLSAAELESMGAHIRSQLEISVTGLLASSPAAAPLQNEP